MDKIIIMLDFEMQNINGRSFDISFSIYSLCIRDYKPRISDDTAKTRYTSLCETPFPNKSEQYTV